MPADSAKQFWADEDHDHGPFQDRGASNHSLKMGRPIIIRWLFIRGTCAWNIV